PELIVLRRLRLHDAALAQRGVAAAAVETARLVAGRPGCKQHHVGERSKRRAEAIRRPAAGKVELRAFVGTLRGHVERLLQEAGALVVLRIAQAGSHVPALGDPVRALKVTGKTGRRLIELQIDGVALPAGLAGRDARRLRIANEDLAVGRRQAKVLADPEFLVVVIEAGDQVGAAAKQSSRRAELHLVREAATVERSEPAGERERNE